MVVPTIAPVAPCVAVRAACIATAPVGSYAVLAVNAADPNVPPVPMFNVDTPKVKVPVPGVKILPLMLVAVAAPKIGEIKVGLVIVGLVENTIFVVLSPVTPLADVKKFNLEDVDVKATGSLILGLVSVLFVSV